MKKRIRIFSLLTAALMAASMAGCGAADNSTDQTSADVSESAQETAAEVQSESDTAAEETAAEASEGTHTVIDHAGREVEVPDNVTRVVIDEIPILSTYTAYFGGEAPHIVGFCGAFKDTISKTVLKDIAPELMETADTVYAQSDLNIEEIMKLEPDVILYNADRKSVV